MSYIKISDIPKMILGENASKSQLKSCQNKLYYRLKKLDNIIEIVNIEGSRCVSNRDFEILKNSIESNNIDVFLETAFTTDKVYEDITMNNTSCSRVKNEHLLNDYCALSVKFNCINSENQTLRSTIKSLQNIITNKDSIIENLNRTIEHINNDKMLPLEIELNQQEGALKEKDVKIKYLTDEIRALRSFLISFNLISNNSNCNKMKALEISKRALITKTSLDNLLNIKDISSDTNVSQNISFSEINNNIACIDNLIKSLEIKDNIGTSDLQVIAKKSSKKKKELGLSMKLGFKDLLLSPFLSLRKITRNTLQFFCKL